MTAEATHIIEEFGALPDPQKREVLAELVRISRTIDYPEISDDELVSAANEVFLDYDRRESNANYPGGHPKFRPPRMWKWMWKTVCPAASPVLTTRR